MSPVSRQVYPLYVLEECHHYDAALLLHLLFWLFRNMLLGSIPSSFKGLGTSSPLSVDWGMFTSTVWTSFSMILFWPVIATGLFDRDVTDEQAVKYPALYETGRLGLEPSLHIGQVSHTWPVVVRMILLSCQQLWIKTFVYICTKVNPGSWNHPGSKNNILGGLGFSQVLQHAAYQLDNDRNVIIIAVFQNACRSFKIKVIQYLLWFSWPRTWMWPKWLRCSYQQLCIPWLLWQHLVTDGSLTNQRSSIEGFAPNTWYGSKFVNIILIVRIWNTMFLHPLFWLQSYDVRRLFNWLFWCKFVSCFDLHWLQVAVVSMGDLDIGATGSYYSFSFMVFSWVTWIKSDPVRYQNLDAFGSYHPKAEHSWTASFFDFVWNFAYGFRSWGRVLCSDLTFVHRGNLMWFRICQMLLKRAC